jgi:hypothetical protein
MQRGKGVGGGRVRKFESSVPPLTGLRYGGCTGGAREEVQQADRGVFERQSACSSMLQGP